MTIFEIDKDMAALLAGAVDEETGELVFAEGLEEKLNALQMAREQKIENCACAYKNYMSEIAALKAQKDYLTKPIDARIKTLTSQAKHAQGFLEYILDGETFKTDKVNISYSKSETTETDSEFADWALKHKRKFPGLVTLEAKVNKTAVKKLLKAGEKIEHAWLETGKMKIE